MSLLLQELPGSSYVFSVPTRMCRAQVDFLFPDLSLSSVSHCQVYVCLLCLLLWVREEQIPAAIGPYPRRLTALSAHEHRPVR